MMALHSAGMQLELPWNCLGNALKSLEFPAHLPLESLESLESLARAIPQGYDRGYGHQDDRDPMKGLLSPGAPGVTQMQPCHKCEI